MPRWNLIDGEGSPISGWPAPSNALSCAAIPDWCPRFGGEGAVDLLGKEDRGPPLTDRGLCVLASPSGCTSNSRSLWSCWGMLASQCSVACVELGAASSGQRGRSLAARPAYSRGNPPLVWSGPPRGVHRGTERVSALKASPSNCRDTQARRLHTLVRQPPGMIRVHG